MWRGFMLNSSAIENLSLNDIPEFMIIFSGGLLIALLIMVDIFTFIFSDEEILKIVRINDQYSFNFVEVRINSKLQVTGQITNRQIPWKGVRDVIASNDFKELKLVFDTDESLKIKDDSVNYYLLLHKIPDYPSFDKDNFFKFLSELETCSTCGMIAEHQRKCRSCSADSSKVMVNDSHEDNLKEAQILHFLNQINENEPLDFFKEMNNGFKKDKTWKPLIDEKDISKFIEEMEKTVANNA